MPDLDDLRRRMREATEEGKAARKLEDEGLKKGDKSKAALGNRLATAAYDRRLELTAEFDRARKVR